MAGADTEDEPHLAAVGGGSANPTPLGGEEEGKMAVDDQVYLKFNYSEKATKFFKNLHRRFDRCYMRQKVYG